MRLGLALQLIAQPIDDPLAIGRRQRMRAVLRRHEAFADDFEQQLQTIGVRRELVGGSHGREVEVAFTFLRVMASLAVPFQQRLHGAIEIGRIRASAARTNENARKDRSERDLDHKPEGG